MVGVVRKALADAIEREERRIEEEAREAVEAERQAQAALARAQAGSGTIEEDGAGSTGGVIDIKYGKTPDRNAATTPAGTGSNAVSSKRAST